MTDLREYKAMLEGLTLQQLLEERNRVQEAEKAARDQANACKDAFKRFYSADDLCEKITGTFPDGGKFTWYLTERESVSVKTLRGAPDIPQGALLKYITYSTSENLRYSASKKRTLA